LQPDTAGTAPAFRRDPFAERMRRRNLAASDQDLDATIAAGLAKFRKLIRGSVHRVIGQYAIQINFRCARKQRQLENDVIQALFWCVAADVEESLESVTENVSAMFAKT
jgi:hypothetical protein